MGELVFVGLGLGGERGVSLQGLDAVGEADMVFAEFYTSFSPTTFEKRLETLVRREITVLKREALEEKAEEALLKHALDKRVVLLVPGDPMIATTHVQLRVRAFKLGIETRVIHGSSIVSAAMGACGLQNYRFGESVTVPYLEKGFVPETLYNVVMKNLRRGLHTLMFLDVRADEGRSLTIVDALKVLLAVEARRREGVFSADRLMVGLARVGMSDAYVKADRLEALIKIDFGAPPHTLIAPGKLHFMEAEALRCFAQAPAEVLGRE